MGHSDKAIEQRSHLRIALMSILAAIVMVGGGIAAVFNPAQAAGESYIATVGNPTAAVPTNSTMLFPVTVNCRNASGCDSATITFERPKLADGTRLDGPMVLSLASGANPAITYRVDNVNADRPTLTFTRFDNGISQLFNVSWRTTDPQVIPGTYTMDWSTQFPKTGYSLTGKASGTVTGTPAPSVQKSANSSGDLFNGALRTFTLNWMRPSRQSGNTGVTTTLVDKLPSNYVFKGFSDYQVGTDMRFRRMDGNNAVLTTENGQEIYSYDEANHQVVVRITRAVDAYIAQRNNGRARISYDVQVNGITGGTELADKTKLTNTVTAQDPKSLSGAAIAVPDSSVTLNYTRNRPGTFNKIRGQSEYGTTTSDDASAPDMERPFTLIASNPGNAPQDLRIVDVTSHSAGVTNDYRYLTRVSLDPVLFNDGRVETYGATVIGTRADGSTKTYTSVPNQVLEIPKEDKIINAEIRVNQLSPMDGMPQSTENGVLRITLTYALRLTTEQITGPNPTESSPTAAQFINNATFYLGNTRMGTGRSFYTLYGKLPSLTPHISVRNLDTGTNFNLVRNQWFEATVGLYANSDSSPAHPEAYMVLPRGFTLGNNPRFSDTGAEGCKPADAWRFEKMEPYNGSERWRMVLKDANDTLQPVDGNNGIYCYKLRISSGAAQAGTYDKVPLTDQMHNIGLWIRERDGKLSHTTMNTSDTYDINSDGDTAGRWRSTSLNTSVASTTGIGVTKTATGDVTGPTSWTSGVDESESVARKNMDFTVTASTTGTTAVKDLVIYDMLPNANNVGDNWKRLVEGFTTDYSADTSFSPNLTGPVTPVDHTKSFTAWYTTAANPCRPELSIAGTNYPDNSCPTFNAKSEWFTDLSGRNLNDITAVRIQINETVFGDFSFKIPMTMPSTDLGGNALNTEDVAINRAAVGAKTVAGSTIPFVGPAYARVVPAGAIGVEKSALINNQPVNQGPQDGNQTLRRGDRMTYVITAAVDPNGVGVVDPVVTDELPAGVTLVDVDNRSNGEYNTETGEWRPGDMNPGDTRTLYLNVEVTGYGDVTNYAYYPDPQSGETPILSRENCAPHTTTNGSERCDSFTFHVDAGDASIRGNVFNDLDWSDTQTDEDNPRPNVTVILNEVLADGSLSPVGQATTDQDGNYVFDSLPGGRYTVEFITEDGVRYAAANQGNDDTIDSDATEALDGRLSTGTFTLGETEQKQDVDLGVQPLATISGLVFHDVNNNGVRDTGEATLSGVSAQLLNEDGTPASLGYTNGIASPASGTSTLATADDGTYTFVGVRPGTYKVRFVTPDGYTVAAPGESETITDADRNDATVKVEENGKLVWTTSETQPFHAPLGTTPHVDAGFTELGSAEGIFWTDTNGDGIRDAGEEVRPGVTITLFRVLSDGTRVEVATATTDENGHYGWYDLPPGQYAPQVTLPEGTIFGPLVDGNPATDAGNDYDTTGANTGTLPPGAHLMHLDGAIVPLSAISGIAFWDDNADGQQQETEPQLPDGQTATIELYKVGQDTPVQTVQAASGAYEFTGVAPGEYYVKVTNLSEGFFSQVVDPTSPITDSGFNDFAQSTASGQTRNFTVVGGQTYPHIDGGIVRQQSLSGSVWNDANNNGVRDEGETPRAGVTVTIVDALQNTQTTVTDAQGNYTFQGVAIGEATVTFTAPEGTKFTSGTDSDVNSEGVVTVTVVGSENVTGIDAGLVTPTSVSGRVVLDINRDGEIPATEPGVERLTVTLRNAAGDEVATAPTDADGNYTFGNVMPGTGYYVEFTKPDGSVFYPAPTPAELFDPDRNDADPLTGRTAAFDVINGEPVTNIDAAIVNFGSISGIAFNDSGSGASGNDGVKQDDESVRPGLPVALVDANNNVVATTITGEDGSYRFDNIAPGDYRIFIDDANLPSLEISRIASNNSGDVDRNNINRDGYSHTVTLAANQDVTNVDIGVVPKAGIAGNVFTDLNRNGVRDEGEPGIAEVTVKVYSPDRTLVAETTTTDLGTWFVENVQFNQEYVVEFETPTGYTQSVLETLPETVSDPLQSDIDANGFTKEFTLGQGQYPNVDAGFILGANASGIAFNDADNDGTRDDAEALLPGITVTLYNTDDPETPVATTTTNQDGFYEFTNLPEGTYVVRFTKPEGTQFTEQQSTDLTVPGLSVVNATGETVPFTIEAGKDIANLDAGILDLASISGVAFTDTNRDGLRTAEDTPRSGITVTLRKADGTEVTTTTAEDGSYSFKDLEPGEYTVTFAPADNAAFTTENAGDNNAIDSDVNTNGATEQFRVNAGQKVTNVDAGYVVDANISGTVWVDTNNNGERDGSEQPYAGLEVQIYLLESQGGITDENWVTQTTTDELGQYEILNVPAGTYAVRFVTPEGYVFSPKTGTVVSEAGLSDVKSDGYTDEFEVLPNQDVNTIDAGIVPTTSLSGMAFFDSNRDGLRADEAPRGDITVTLTDANGNVVATTETAEDGTYSFDGLRPGEYTVAFESADGEVFSPTGGDSTVDNNGQAKVTITAGTPVVGVDAGYITTATISGLAFLDYNGDGESTNDTPAAGVTVRLLDANGNELPDGLSDPRSVDADGRYSFDVPPGRYRVAFFNEQGLAITQYPTREGGITDPGYNDAGSNGHTAAFTVVAGGDYPNIDAGFAVLGSISGTVFNDVDDDALRGTDPGVSGITVELIRGNDVVATTTTNEFGDYTFTNVVGGDYTVRFTKPAAYDWVTGGDSPVSAEGDTATRAVTLTITADSAALEGIDAGVKLVPVIETTTVTTDPVNPEVTPTETTTIEPTETPSPTDPSETPTVTVTVVVPPVTETVTVTDTSTAAETTPPVTETVTITPTEVPSVSPGETPTVTITEIVPPVTEPVATTVVTETTTVTEHPETPEVTPTETVTITPTTTPEPTEPGETPTVTVTVVVPPTEDPPVETTTVTVTAEPSPEAPTETVTITPTETPTPTAPDHTPTATVTVVVPPVTEPESPVVTETITVTWDPDAPEVTPTVTETREPTDTPTTTPATVTATVIVPPETTVDPTEPAEPDPVVTRTVTVTVNPSDPANPPTETIIITPEAPTTTPTTVTATIVVPPSTTVVEPTETPTVTNTVTVTMHPDDPEATPTETITIEPTEQPTTAPADGTHTVTATVVVPPSTEVEEPTDPTEETETSSSSSSSPAPVSPRPSTSAVTPSGTVTTTAPPVTKVDPTAPVTRGATGGSGSTPQKSAPTTSSAPRSGISGLAQTGANVLALLVIAAALILIGVFLIRRKNRD